MEEELLIIHHHGCDRGIAVDQDRSASLKVQHHTKDGRAVPAGSSRVKGPSPGSFTLVLSLTRSLEDGRRQLLNSRRDVEDVPDVLAGRFRPTYGRRRVEQRAGHGRDRLVTMNARKTQIAHGPERKPPSGRGLRIGAFHARVPPPPPRTAGHEAHVATKNPGRREEEERMPTPIFVDDHGRHEREPTGTGAQDLPGLGELGPCRSLETIFLDGRRAGSERAARPPDDET